MEFINFSVGSYYLLETKRSTIYIAVKGFEKNNFECIILFLYKNSFSIDFRYFLNKDLLSGLSFKEIRKDEFLYMYDGLTRYLRVLI